MYSTYTLGSGLVVYLLACLSGLVPGRHMKTITYLLSAAGSLLALIASLQVLISGRGVVLTLPLSWGILAPRFAMDGLSAVFVGIISLLGVAASVYAIGYTRNAHHGEAPWARLAYGVFLLTMVLVTLSQDAVSFLFAWELMALSSYLLVVTEVRRQAAARAGVLYLVMTHGATACLLVAFLLWSRASGSLQFSHWAAAGAVLPAALKNGLFLLLLVGFSAKAGVVPLHIWLPEAHPAAPSHVSALMSGAMLKTAIYGLFRFGVFILPAGRAWWGMVVLLLGVGSAILGVMYALVERDLKRLLAYSSVENIGIILMAFGAGLVARSFNLAALTGLALTAALLHAVNHALFKGLLFLNAGSVVSATGTRDIDSMGGLIRRMPLTAASFLCGSLAIAALPPLNGFCSEWLTFQTLVGLGLHLPTSVVRLAMPLAASGLALTGALAAYCFVKAFGAAFLALPRSEKAGQAAEAPLTMWVPPAVMAALCMVFGVWPGLPFRLLGRTLLPLGVAFPDHGRFTPGLSSIGSSIRPDWVVLFFAALFVVILVLWLVRRPKVVVGETWNCGRSLDSTMEYSAMAFSQPAGRVFSKVIHPVQQVSKQHITGTPFVSRVRVQERLRPVFREFIYRPLRSGVVQLARKARSIQDGRLQVYLLYVLATLVVLLIVARG